MWMQKHLAQIVTIEVSFIRWTHMILSMGLSSSRLILDRIFTLTWELINYNVRVVTICPGFYLCMSSWLATNIASCVNGREI